MSAAAASLDYLAASIVFMMAMIPFALDGSDINISNYCRVE
jgi:hypothetical protein